jgi:hypothetical protein
VELTRRYAAHTLGALRASVARLRSVGARHARDIHNRKTSSRAWPAPTGGWSSLYRPGLVYQFFVAGGDGYYRTRALPI